MKRTQRRELEARLRREGAYTDVVQAGPFTGIRYPAGMWACCKFQKIFGTYEHELHELITHLAATKNYQTILNIGAADGFYSVGFARLFPSAQVIAFEGDDYRFSTSQLLVRENGLESRITMHGYCEVSKLVSMKITQPVLLWMDIDTGERTLLDPAKVPWLREVEIVVELHDCLEAGLTDLIRSRFEQTHTIKQFTNQGIDYGKYPALRRLTSVEIAALIDEDRNGIQDWFYMVPKTASGEVSKG